MSGPALDARTSAGIDGLKGSCRMGRVFGYALTLWVSHSMGVELLVEIEYRVQRGVLVTGPAMDARASAAIDT